MLTFHVSMGVSVAQHVLESECNVETSDSAKMTKKSAAREQAVRPLLLNGLFFVSDSSLFPSLFCSHWTSFDKKATSNWQQPLLRALDVARGAPQAGVPSYAEASLPGSPGNLSVLVIEKNTEGGGGNCCGSCLTENHS